ncbi:hypothetical protein D3C74_461030 [compost metagenome]
MLLYISYPVAPIIIGTDTRKVNSAAATRLIPANKPPEIVDPEREKPGHNARI